MKNIINKLLKFPPPTAYGGGSDIALPMDDFNHDPKLLTWEGYYKNLKKDFPIKYFILRQIPEFIQRKIWWTISKPIKDVFYYLKCQLVPNKRYHSLSLVQPKTNTDDDYTYGWIDADRQILLACMNILVKYVEKEVGTTKFQEHISYLLKESEKYDALSEEDKKLQYNYREDYARNKKVLDIYMWWKYDRKLDLNKKKEYLDIWYNNRKNPIGDEHFKLLDEIECKILDEEQQMLKELLEVRSYMWT